MDPECWVVSGRILRFSFGTESTICEKPDPKSLFNFSSSKSLRIHVVSKNMGKFRFDRWTPESEQDQDSKILEQERGTESEKVAPATSAI